MILKLTRSHSHLDPDLLIDGAPLRNRTVDLLLTMDIGGANGQEFYQANIRFSCLFVPPRACLCLTVSGKWLP
jgi:hypothetical protein